jgi:hypothetical protein
MTNFEIGGSYSLLQVALLQVALLVMYYGFKISLPWWVLWFPSLLVGGVLALVAVAFVVWIIIMFIGELVKK